MDTEIRKPGLHLLLLESRVLVELGSGVLTTMLKRRRQVGHGRAVIVIPGFGANDLASGVLRTRLKKLGYNAVGWGLGVNKGTNAKVREALIEKVKTLSASTGKPVSIIGWSLGGVFARELARKLPEYVHSVITLGTPFSGSPSGNRLFGLSQRVSGKKFTDQDAEAFARRAEPPPVITVALHSRTDGVVSWQCSLEKERVNTSNEAVFSSHFGYLFNPLVMHKIEKVLEKK